MCRMAGKISVTSEPVAFELLDASHSLRQQADSACRYECGEGPHRDGCGIAWLENGKIQLEKRSREDAWDASFEDKVRGISTSIFIAHNRFATSSPIVNVEGAHPFVREVNGAQYAFCHNGTVHTYLEEARKQGVPDSRIIFDNLLLANEPNDAAHIRARVQNIAQKTEYTSMSGLLISKDKLYLWRVFDESKDAQLRNRYYTLYVKQSKGAVTVASEPLDGEGWELIPNFTFIKCKFDGNSIKSEQCALMRPTSKIAA